MKTILLIDDDKQYLKMMDKIFSGSEYKLVVENETIEGIKKIRSVNPDLILLDIDLPKKSGLELLEAGFNTINGKSIPVIIVSSNSDAITREIVKRLGAIEFISKPFEVDKLFELIQGII